jgi:hypothetical protein
MTMSGFVTFCDDIRFENTGKGILIGVYSEDLVASHLPQVTPLSFWARIGELPVGELKLNLKIGVNGSPQHTTDVVIVTMRPDRPTNLYFIGAPIEIEQPGEIFFELSGFPEGGVFRDTLPVRTASEG